MFLVSQIVLIHLRNKPSSFSGGRWNRTLVGLGSRGCHQILTCKALWDCNCNKWLVKQTAHGLMSLNVAICIVKMWEPRSHKLVLSIWLNMQTTSLFWCGLVLIKHTEYSICLTEVSCSSCRLREENTERKICYACMLCQIMCSPQITHFLGCRRCWS